MTCQILYKTRARDSRDKGPRLIHGGSRYFCKYFIGFALLGEPHQEIVEVLMFPMAFAVLLAEMTKIMKK